MEEQNQNKNQNKNKEQGTQDINELLKVRRTKLSDLVEKGKNPFTITKFDVTAHSDDIKNNLAKYEEQEVTVAGRLMSKRVMGNASFCHIQDKNGLIQSYVQRDLVGEEDYKDFKKYDVGDIVGIRGKVFVTKTGETSIKAEEISLLSKSLQILPEKFHGLTNTDIRYRQRYT
ncbi:MAG: lysine--tRNA ligase, partial [Lachnospiraceae bacterium]|nr:lysine--tRNA ligase [Lachnospiraceae bacterium]